jgi:Zn-dependent protease
MLKCNQGLIYIQAWVLLFRLLPVAEMEGVATVETDVEQWESLM